MSDTRVGCVQFAKMLGQVGLIDFQILSDEDVRRVTGKNVRSDENNIYVRIKGQIYWVCNTAASSGDKSYAVRNYNMQFYYSKNTNDFPRIDEAQNREILLDVAYRLMRFIPMSCDFGLLDLDGWEKATIKRHGDEDDGKYKHLDFAGIENLNCVLQDDVKSAYTEIFSCKLKANIAGSVKNKDVTFRYFHSVKSGGEDAGVNHPKGNSSLAIKLPSKERLDLTDPSAKEENERQVLRKFKQELGAKKSTEDTAKMTAIDGFDTIVVERLRDGLNFLINTKGIMDNAGEIWSSESNSMSPEALRYWRVRTPIVRITGTPTSPLFDENSMVVYDTPVVPTARGNINFNAYRCQLPSCVNYAIDGNGVTLHLTPDPDWRKPVKGETDKFGHPLGCDCMKETCAICGQPYFGRARHKELKEYLGYSLHPRKAFYDKDKNVKASLDAGQSTVADYCMCQNNLLWFYDEMYNEEVGAFEHVVVPKNVVFVHSQSQEVVAAFSPESYRNWYASFDALYTEATDRKIKKLQLGQDEMIAKSVCVFFTDFADRQADLVSKSRPVGKYANFATFHKVMKQIHATGGYLDRLTAAEVRCFLEACDSVGNVRDNYVETNIAAIVNAMGSGAIASTPLNGDMHAMYHDIADVLTEYLSIFKARLSEALGAKKNANVVRLTGINSCALCACCGALYYIRTTDNEGVVQLAAFAANGDKCHDHADGGPWTTEFGSKLYRAGTRKGVADHINMRTVIDARGKEVEYAKWQKELAKKVNK